MLCSMPRRVVDELGIVAAKVVEHDLEHAVRAGRPKRLGEQRRLSLVERRGRHLDCRRRPDLGRRRRGTRAPAPVEARDLGRARPGRGRRPSFRPAAAAGPRSSRRRRRAPRSARRAATAAIVAGAIALRSATSGPRTRLAAAASRDVAGDLDGRAGRDDREHDLATQRRRRRGSAAARVPSASRAVRALRPRASRRPSHRPRRARARPRSPSHPG